MSDSVEKYLDLTGLTQYDKKIKEAIQKDITTAWATSTSYLVGNYVVYNGVLYQCTTAHTSTDDFDSTKWNQVKLIDNVIPTIASNLDKSLITANIADAYSSSSPYSVGDYVTYNGQLYKCNTAISSPGESWNSNHWTAVQVMEQVADASAITSVSGTAPVSATTSNKAVTVSLADAYGDTKNPYGAKSPNTVLAGPNSGSTSAVPTFRTLVAADTPAVIPKAIVAAKGDLIVGSGDASVTNLGVGTNGQFLKANSSATKGIEWASLSSSDVGLGNVVNTGDSDTWEQDGADKFTTGGAYALKIALEEEIRTNASHYRGSFANWTAVPTTDSTSVTPHYTSASGDATGHATPTENDYMIVENASDYSSGYTGTWRFIFTGTWNESQGATSKTQWTPAYKIDSDKSFKTIDSTKTTAQSTSASEELIGTGTINLHKIAKTGTYSDLISRPTFAVNSGSATTISAMAFKNGSNVSITQSGQEITIASTDTGATTLSGNTAESGKAITAASYNATNRTITFTKASFVQSSDLPTVEFNVNPYTTGTVTTIKGMKVGDDQYNFSTTEDTNYYATSIANSGLKIANGYTSGTASSTYDLYVPNANGTTQAGVVTTGDQTFGGVKTFSSAPKFDSGASYKQGSTSTYATIVGNSSASAATTITLPSTTGTLALDSAITVTGVNNGVWELNVNASKQIEVKPYSSSSAGHFDNSFTNPSSTTPRLNWNGRFYASELYIGGTKVLNHAVSLTQGPGSGSEDDATTVTTWGLDGTEYSFESISKTEINSLFS